ncbi:hypothetical protein [Zhongshania sp.]|uniref:hypothetical protein n=1 Tax=Zhongshania sp. TaxID=1971902 RepID=UPI003563EAB2
MNIYLNKYAAVKMFKAVALAVLMSPITSVAHESIVYRYDALGRLTSANNGDKLISYSYDAAGTVLKREIRAAIFVGIETLPDTCGPVIDESYPIGTRNIPMVSFSLSNPSDAAVNLSEISINMDGTAASFLALTRLNLIYDANANTIADAGEEVVAQLIGSPSASGEVLFTFLAPVTIGAGSSLHFTALVDF